MTGRVAILIIFALLVSCQGIDRPPLTAEAILTQIEKVTDR